MRLIIEFSTYARRFDRFAWMIHGEGYRGVCVFWGRVIIATYNTRRWHEDD